MKSRLSLSSRAAMSAQTRSTFLRREMSAWMKVGWDCGLMVLSEAMAVSAAGRLRPMR